MSGTAPFYTQALSPLPGRCFRLVASQSEAGPTHCPQAGGLARVLEACEGHRPR